MKGRILVTGALVLVAVLLAVLAGNAVVSAGSYTEPPDYRSFLKIDIHTHIFADFPAYVQMMRRDNLRGINICTGGTDPEMVKLQQQTAERIQAAYPDTFAFASTFDLTARDQADYAARTDEWMTSCVESGALMIKMWKDVGMEIKDQEIGRASCRERV